jgi:hypothetical protein
MHFCLPAADFRGAETSYPRAANPREAMKTPCSPAATLAKSDRTSFLHGSKKDQRILNSSSAIPPPVRLCPDSAHHLPKLPVLISIRLPSIKPRSTFTTTHTSFQ